MSTMVHAPAEAEYLVLTTTVAHLAGEEHRGQVVAWLDPNSVPSANGGRPLDPDRGYQAVCSCDWTADPRGDCRVRADRGGRWYDADKAARTDLSRHLSPPRRPSTPASPRDTQRARVYAAERSIDGQPWDTHFRSLSETQAWLDAFLASRWFRARYGRLTVPIEAGSGCHAHYLGTITLNRWGRRPLVVLHELAHVLVSAPDVPAHGPLFAACLVSEDLRCHYCSRPDAPVAGWLVDVGPGPYRWERPVCLDHANAVGARGPVYPGGFILFRPLDQPALPGPGEPCGAFAITAYDHGSASETRYCHNRALLGSCPFAGAHVQAEGRPCATRLARRYAWPFAIGDLHEEDVPG